VQMAGVVREDSAAAAPVVEAVEALAAAGQAADMMTAALVQADRTSGELRPAR